MGTIVATRLWGLDGIFSRRGRADRRRAAATHTPFRSRSTRTPDGQDGRLRLRHWTGFGLSTQYEFGTYAEGGQGGCGAPFDISDARAGRAPAVARVVANDSASGPAQDDGSSVPHSNDFSIPGSRAPGVGQHRGARSRRVRQRRAGAVETWPSGSGANGRKVAMVPFANLGLARRRLTGWEATCRRGARRLGASISQDGTPDGPGTTIAASSCRDAGLVFLSAASPSTCNLSAAGS